MKFSQEDPTEAHLIQSYDDDKVIIQVGNPPELTTITTSCVVFTDKIDTASGINVIPNLVDSDITYFKQREIEVLILAQPSITRLPVKTIAQFSQHNIGIEQMLIGAGCRTYNLLVTEGRRVALLLNF